RLPHSRVDHVGVRLGDGERSDRAALEILVRHRQPVRPPVGRLPDSAARSPEVIDERLTPHSRPRRDAAYTDSTSAAEVGPLVPLPDPGRRGRRLFLLGGLLGRRDGCGPDGERTESHGQTAQGLQGPLLMTARIGRRFYRTCSAFLGCLALVAAGGVSPPVWTPSAPVARGPPAPAVPPPPEAR